MARIVIGVGNDLRGDDAAGWETVRRLVPSPSLDLHEHGGDAPGLISLWGPDDDVVVVDAVVSSAPPGTILEVDALAAPLPANVSWATTHGAGVVEGIELARVLDQLPKSLVLIGISAKHFELGKPMTREVERAVDEVVQKLKRRTGGSGLHSTLCVVGDSEGVSVGASKGAVERWFSLRARRDRR